MDQKLKEAVKPLYFDLFRDYYLEPAGLNDRVETRHLAGPLDKSIRSFREALQLDPDYVDAAHNLGRSLMHRVDILVEKGEPWETDCRAAVDAFSIVIRQCGEREPVYLPGMALFERGMALWNLRERTRAARDLKRALNTNPEFEKILEPEILRYVKEFRD